MLKFHSKQPKTDPIHTNNTIAHFPHLVLVILSTIFMSSVNAHIEFEDITSPGTTVNDKSQSTKGFSFLSTPATNDSILVKRLPAICDDGCIDNGTQYLHAYNSDQTGPYEILMIREDAEHFDFHSFELSTLFNVVPLEGTELEIIGTKSNGEIVVQSIVYDDDPDTFQHVAVDESFVDLESVLFRSFTAFPALDNLKAYLVQNIDFEDVNVPDSSVAGAFQASSGFTFVNTPDTKDAVMVTRLSTTWLHSMSTKQARLRL